MIVELTGGFLLVNTPLELSSKTERNTYLSIKTRENGDLKRSNLTCMGTIMNAESDIFAHFWVVEMWACPLFMQA